MPDLFRRVRGKPDTKAERLDVDRAAMLALPPESFEARRVEQRGANSLCLVSFDRNDYSVPTAVRPPRRHRPRWDRTGPLHSSAQTSSPPIRVAGEENR